MAIDGWQHIRLGDIIKITHGWSFKGELFSEELTGKPIVVNIGNFRYEGGFRFDSTTLREYRGKFPEEYILKPNDILLVMTCQTSGGEILGIPGRIPDDDRKYLHNQRMGKVVNTDEKVIDNSFLYWLFLWSEFNRHLFITASGSKILHTSPSRIESFQFYLPPLPEQRAIAGMLGALDDKIELNRLMNQTLESMARAVFRQWFVDGENVVNWEEKPLDEIANFLNGLALQKFPAEDDEYLPVIKISQLRTNDTEGADKASTNIPPQYIIEDGDILFSWSGSLEVVVWCGGKGALNQHLFKVTSEKFPKWFYYYWTKHHLLDFQEIAAGKATTMGHIQRHHLKAAKVLVPSDEELQEMDKIMSPLLEKIIINSLEIRTLASLRDTLLPKLMKGEVRVKA